MSSLSRAWRSATNTAEQDRRGAERLEYLRRRLLPQFGYHIEPQPDDEEERPQILVLDKDTCSCALAWAARRAATTVASRVSEVAQNGTMILPSRPLMAVPPSPRLGEGVRRLSRQRRRGGRRRDG